MGGLIINQIPGAVVNRNLSVQNWREAPEPAYRIPVGLGVEVTIDGSGLAKPDREEVTLIGPGDYVGVSWWAGRRLWTATSPFRW